MGLTLLLMGTGLYLFCLAAVALLQRRLMYFPCRASQKELQMAAVRVGFTPWLNSNGEAIGWFRAGPQTPSRRCILVLHGNAGCAPDRFPYADAFGAVESIDFYILEYPGYGGRAGVPSQQSILRAAEDAVANIPEPCSLFLVGESLGTGPASWLAGKYSTRISGLLLIAPYNHMTAVAKRHMPLFPVKAMLRDRYPSSIWLQNYSGPVAVLLAGRDTVVPTDLGRDLYAKYSGPKKLWLEPEAGHNDLHDPDPRFWREVLEFWNNPLAPGSPGHGDR